jgi:hypothetical protein
MMKKQELKLISTNSNLKLLFSLNVTDLPNLHFRPELSIINLVNSHESKGTAFLSMS